MTRLLVGTSKGLWEEGEGIVGDDPVVALSPSGAVLNDADPAATCLVEWRGTNVVGTAGAHLVGIPSFDEVPGREDWYTPWGDPPDTRSLAVAADGSLLVNVHVGGLWRLDGSTMEWEQVVDVDDDVHEVAVDPVTGLVAVAAAVGLARSTDDGRTFEWTTEGLHATYARAVSVGERHAFVSASTGPDTREAGLYRGGLSAASGPLERCSEELGWFEANIDTRCVAARGATVAFGVAGTVFRSDNHGDTWTELAADLPHITSVVLL